MTDYLTPEEIMQLQLKIKKASKRAKELVAANAEEKQGKTKAEHKSQFGRE